MYNKNKQTRKGVRSTLKVMKQIASYLAKKLLATHYTGNIGYYLCLFMQTQFQLGSYIHACTHSLANLQNVIPNLAGLCFIFYACQSRD